MRSHEILTRRETAERLRISTRTLSRIVEAGELRPIRLTPEGHPKFPVTEIEAFIDRRRKESQ